MFDWLGNGLSAIAKLSLLSNINSPIRELNHLAEGLLLEIVGLLKTAIETVAIVILVLGIIKALQDLVVNRLRINRESKLNQVRLDLGVVLALSLEFLLAADIIATAVSPSWDALGKLAAISAIRTFLNFFLEKEVQELAKETLMKLQRYSTMKNEQ